MWTFRLGVWRAHLHMIRGGFGSLIYPQAQACSTMKSAYAMTSTFHIYSSDGGWVVQREGKAAETFSTQREAIQAARQIVRDKNFGQLVIHGRDGRIRDHETYGMTRVQDPPKKSRRARQIGLAVGKLALDRMQPDTHPSRDHSSKG
jgi:Uncharacterized protein conserved in bacteria (DUF2188)